MHKMHIQFDFYRNRCLISKLHAHKWSRKSVKVSDEVIV